MLLLTLVPSAPEGQRAAYGTSEHNSQPCRRGSEKPVWFFPGAALCQELPSSLSTCPCVRSGVFQVWIWEWCCAQALAWFLQKLLLKRRGLYISSTLSSCYTNVLSVQIIKNAHTSPKQSSSGVTKRARSCISPLESFTNQRESLSDSDELLMLPFACLESSFKKMWMFLLAVKAWGRCSSPHEVWGASWHPSPSP